MKEYSMVFQITPYTVFALDKYIYTNFPLPDHLLEHEEVHLKRQQKVGVDVWVEKYLTDEQFRLNEEVIAYRKQLDYIKDRELRNKVMILCAKDLSSSLYGNICTIDEAYKLLRAL